MVAEEWPSPEMQASLRWLVGRVPNKTTHTVRRRQPDKRTTDRCTHIKAPLNFFLTYHIFSVHCVVYVEDSPEFIAYWAWIKLADLHLEVKM